MYCGIVRCKKRGPSLSGLEVGNGTRGFGAQEALYEQTRLPVDGVVQRLPEDSLSPLVQVPVNVAKELLVDGEGFQGQCHSLLRMLGGCLLEVRIGGNDLHSPLDLSQNLIDKSVSARLNGAELVSEEKDLGGGELAHGQREGVRGCALGGEAERRERGHEPRLKPICAEL